MDWYSKSLSQVVEELKTSEQGLTHEEASKRLGIYGANVLPETKGDSLALIFLRQFQSPLIYLLVGAALVVFFLEEVIDAGVILFVLFFNALVGTIQEGRAQRTLLALKKFVQGQALVLRDGKEYIIPDSQLVPGDLILLAEGTKVPADARIIFANTLKIDEASLTGESERVHKIADAIERPDLQIAEQKNMVFKGTYVFAGNGKALVVATGLTSVIGKISEQIVAIDSEIPLKMEIRSLSRMIIIAASGICVSLLGIGVLAVKPIKEMFVIVVSLAVSIIPEGLPIVLTLVLATGVWRMSKRNALVKRLQAVEALGQARILAVDKTGTLTKNEMVIQQVFIDGTFFDVGGVGYEPKGQVSLRKRDGEGDIIVPPDFPELLLAGRVAAFCANARLAFLEDEKRWHVAGDPTEAALLVFAQKVGFMKDDLERLHPLLQEAPFDYKTRYHATLHDLGEKKILTLTGAPEVLLALCKKHWQKGVPVRFGQKDKEHIEEVFWRMSEEGLRVLAFAFAYQRSSSLNPEKFPLLVFGGFYGMKDALRPEVKEAIAKAGEAGIRVVMITGDHKGTAKAIAKEAGIFKEGDKILTGKEIDSLLRDELQNELAEVSVLARVSPEHKFKIIDAYKSRGEVVAMTGDGVNDAPSLVAADLGIAMGTIGSEVAKEASDIVLLDDNLSSIIAAVEEGRSIYKTIKKVLLYLFSTSLGEVLTIAGALFLGYPLPLVASQILWLNLVTDGFLDVALAMEPKEKGLLQGSFERGRRFFIDSLMISRMLVMALPMMLGTLYLFSGYLQADLNQAWTISLTTLAVFQWCNAWNCRSEDKSIFGMNPFSNPFLVGATGIVILLQLGAVYTPFGQTILRTAPLSLAQWLMIIPIAFTIIGAEEIRKFIYRHGIFRY